MVDIFGLATALRAAKIILKIAFEFKVVVVVVVVAAVPTRLLPVTGCTN